MERIDEKHYRLTSGRILDAAAGVIGIANGAVFSGYNELPADEWTPEDRSELADFMIDQWRRFKGSTAEEDRDEAGSNVTGGFVVISDTDDGTAVIGRNGDWLPGDVASDRVREHALRFSSIGEAWTFLNEKPADWWLSAPGARPRVVDTW
jgi:hypothetical protein